MPDKPKNITQVIEQATAALRDIAPVVKKYFNDLKAQGFTDAEALHLTMAMQTSIMSGGKK